VSSGVTFHAPKNVENVREWTSTFSSELPFWELESQWTLEFSEGNYKGQKSLDSKVRYINGNLLELKCLNWARMTHLGTWNTSYDQKKGWESNGQFDSQPLKVRNRPDSLVWRWCATYHWKDFDKGYNFALDCISIWDMHTKLWVSKVLEVLVFRILEQFFRTTYESQDKNDIWVLVPWPRTEHTIRGKVLASPKFGSWWILWVHVCLWLVHAPKMLQLCINQLVVWFV
jgi:hypothetical protein